MGTNTLLGRLHFGQAVPVEVPHSRVDTNCSAAAETAKTYNVVTRQAVPADSTQLVAMINKAYVADAFFKKPEFADRATPDNVASALAGTGPDIFLVASFSHAPETLVGAIRIGWCDASKVGTFGWVTSVVERCGVGGALVRAAEEQLCKAGSERIEMSVIDLREDVLRPWYTKLGYTRGTDAESKPFVAPEILEKGYESVLMVPYRKKLGVAHC